MINLINEHWLGLIIYLVGCILAWGKINSQIYTDWSKSTDFRGFKISIVTFSWIGFLFSIFMWSGDAKFFKWLPILLLWCMVGVGCKDSPEQQIHDKTIYSKDYTNFWGNPMPKSICRFTVYSGTTIEDSCTKYQIGDTLK